jgi:hypothetical protein
MSLPRALLSAFVMLTLALAAQAQNAGPQKRRVKVRRGQTLQLSLLTPLDSGHASVGDSVVAKLVQPLVDEGVTVLPVDWVVHGKVTKVKRAGHNCQSGEVVWELGPVAAPSGEQLRVQRVYSYPYDPNLKGASPDWVPLDTPWKKIGRAPIFVGELAAFIALSPVLVPLGIAVGTSGKCKGEEGQDMSLPHGSNDLYAISRDALVTPLSLRAGEVLTVESLQRPFSIWHDAASELSCLLNCLLSTSAG